METTTGTKGKWTAGPWRLVTDSREGAAGRLCIESATDVVTQGAWSGRRIAIVPESLGSARQAANARLIAQAPAMAELLQRFVIWSQKSKTGSLLADEAERILASIDGDNA